MGVAPPQQPSPLLTAGVSARRSSAQDSLLELAARAGDLLLRSGAEISRVEDTIERIGRSGGGRQVSAYATPTGVFVSIDGETRIVRVRQTRNDLDRVARVNSLSRRLASGQLTVAEALAEIDRLERLPDPYPRWAVQVGGGISAAGFAYLFGGRGWEWPLAGLFGYLVAYVLRFLPQVQGGLYVRSWAGGVLASLLSAGAVMVHPAWHLEPLLLGTLMVLVPGVAITNGMRDLLAGELVSGVTRVVEALMVAVAIAAGVALVLAAGGAS
ncbi:MAG: threonine/serine exporter family protein [Limnochordaceae bacterium]|nr:threonine/serine exporter family protein [Limnochordaceae bacterium]